MRSTWRLALSIPLLAACGTAGLGPTATPTPAAALAAATERAVRGVAGDFSACSATAITAEAQAGCYVGAVRELAGLRFPPQLSGLAHTVATSGGTADTCYRAVTVQTLDRCSSLQAQFFRQLTNLEYSIAQQMPTPSTAPAYWNLAPTAALEPDLGSPLFIDTMNPPQPGWPQDSFWSIGSDRRYLGRAPAARLTFASMPFDVGTEALGISVDAQFTGPGDGALGVECRVDASRRYLFVVTAKGVSGALRSEQLSSPPTTVDAVAVTQPQSGSPMHLSAACTTLSTSESGAANRLLLFVNRRLVIDTVDVWPGQTGRAWRGGLVMEGGRTDSASANFSNVTVRDFSAEPA